MVRFSCFQGHVHAPKHKKTGQLSTEAMHKTLEDSSQNQALKNLSYMTTENKPCFKEEGDIPNNIADHATDYSPIERDCRSEEIEGKYSTDNDSVVHKKSQIKKCQSLGSGMNLEGRIPGADVSEDEMEHRFSYDESASRSGIIGTDCINNHGLSLSDQFQEPMLSDSVQVDSDFTKNISTFSIEEQTEKEGADRDDICLSGPVDSGDVTLHVRPAVVKSSSLPSMGTPKDSSSSFLRRSRSLEDLNALDSGKMGSIHEVERQIQYQERENSMYNNDKSNGENPVDENDETYNYVASAKDWIVPVSDGANMEEAIRGETSFHHLDEVPTEDFRLKRIEDWVINLQHFDPLEESNVSDPCYDEELPKTKALEESTAMKLEGNVKPGAEAAKRYISSLNASATAAQLTNLGLVVIPYLSAFGSLKALNLSGNAIVRIAAGALPRGLHILNLSKNNISTIEGLRDLTRLRVLDLSYNRILRIGHGLAACSSLKELYLAGNKISEVEGLHRLLKLNVLDLRFNKISTTKCLGQLAANYNCLHALSLEGNPAQKNVGDEQLKKYVQSLLPNLTYYNRQTIKVGTMKDGSDRSARLSIGSHQMDRGLRSEVKSMRKGTHGISQKVPSSSAHGRKVQASPKSTRGRHGHGHGHAHGRLPPSGMKTTQGHQLSGFSNKLLSLRNDISFPRSRSEGNLGAI